jgi:hypothetical protein
MSPTRQADYGAAALSTDAGGRAFRKWPHHGAEGSTDLDWRAGVKTCGGKLLTAYVREKGQRYGEPTRWVKVGVVCRGCSAWWPLP